MPDATDVPIPTPPSAPPAEHIHTFSHDRPTGEKNTVPPGFTLAHEADSTFLDDALGDVKAGLDARRAADDAAVLAPDPRLAFIRGSVRPALQPALDELDAALKAHLADPNRRLLNEAGVADADAKFAAARDAALATVTAKLTAQLGALEAEAAAAVEAARGIAVAPEDEDAALRLAVNLSHLTVAHGLARVAEFVQEALDDRALAYAALPLLRSLYDREGTEWTRNVELLRACSALKQIVDSAPGLAPARATLARVQRSKWELGELLKSARGDRQAMRLVDRDGRLVLFPDEPAPEPQPRAADGTFAPYAGRRLKSSAQRAADERRRAQLRDEDE